MCSSPVRRRLHRRRHPGSFLETTRSTVPAIVSASAPRSRRSEDDCGDDPLRLELGSANRAPAHVFRPSKRARCDSHGAGRSSKRVERAAFGAEAPSDRGAVLARGSALHAIGAGADAGDIELDAGDVAVDERVVEPDVDRFGVGSRGFVVGSDRFDLGSDFFGVGVIRCELESIAASCTRFASTSSPAASALPRIAAALPRFASASSAVASGSAPIAASRRVSRER